MKTWQTIVKEKNLSVAEIFVSELEAGLRLEAEFYVSDSISNGSFVGADIIDVAQYGTSKGLNEEMLGFPVLRLNEFELFFSGEPKKYCDLLSENDFETLKLKKGDVLICRTNGNPKYVGKAAMVMEDADYAFASYLFRIKTNSKIKPSVLVTYLNSKSGRREVEKYAIVSNQANFSPAKFRQISIPEIPTDLQERIDNLFTNAWISYKESSEVRKEAEKLLLKEINLEGYVPSEENTSVRELAECLADNRFDAEYWEPRFDEVLQKIWKSVSLGDIAQIKRGSLISPEFYSEYGVPYIRGADFSSLEIEDGNMTYVSPNFTRNNETIVSVGNILFPLVGSVGKTALVTKPYSGSYISNNLGKIALITQKFLPEYIQALFQSIVGQMQFERLQMQTAQPKISDSDMKKIKIPMLSIQQQKEIAKLMTISRSKKDEARVLLEKAKRAVEIFIEKDEQDALRYLAS